MPDVTSLEGQITTMFSQKLNVEVPSVETDLIETGLVDSLTFVECLTQLEEEFGVTVALEDLEIDHFRTVSRIARFVAAKASAFEDDDRRGDPGLVADAQM
jgi:acyl carrier protein